MQTTPATPLNVIPFKTADSQETTLQKQAGKAILIVNVASRCGHTPDAVRAQAAWVAAQLQAKITWAANADADLAHYEVRGAPGDSYTSDDESILATILPDAAREYPTDFALTAAGLTDGFKVYVVLHSGNEKGSAPVYVTRPT